MNSIPKIISSLVIKSQQLISFISMIFLIVAFCGTSLVMVTNDALTTYWLSSLMTLLISGGVIYANISSIKRPHVASFVIECVVLCLFFVIMIYGDSITGLYQHQANSAMLALNHFLTPIAARDFSFILDAFKLAWLHILGVGLFYTLRIGIFYAEQRRLVG